MLSKMASTMTSDSFRVISTTRETSSIRSAFVIASSPRCHSVTKPQYRLKIKKFASYSGLRSFKLITSSIVVVAAAAWRW